MSSGCRLSAVYLFWLWLERYQTVEKQTWYFLLVRICSTLLQVRKVHEYKELVHLRYAVMGKASIYIYDYITSVCQEAPRFFLFSLEKNWFKSVHWVAWCISITATERLFSFSDTRYHCYSITARITVQLLSTGYLITFVGYIPSDSSPMRKMCGQCCNVLAKKGLVTPSITGGLQR